MSVDGLLRLVRILTLRIRCELERIADGMAAMRKMAHELPFAPAWLERAYNGESFYLPFQSLANLEWNAAPRDRIPRIFVCNQQ